MMQRVLLALEVTGDLLRMTNSGNWLNNMVHKTGMILQRSSKEDQVSYI
jgi:hypothetical protein